MPVRFLSTMVDAPPGFTARQPTRADLLRGTIVVLVRSPDEARALVRGSEDRIHGVMVSVDPAGGPAGAATARLGKLLWQVTVPPAMRGELHGLLAGFAEAIADADVAQEQNIVVDKEVERLRAVLVATRAHYNAVTERLRQHVEQVSQLNSSLQDQIERLEQMKAALRASEEDLATTLDAIGDCVITTDAGGAVRRMNPAAEALTGWPRADAVGRPVTEVLRLITDEVALAADPTAAAAASAAALDRPAVLRTRDGCERLIEHTSTALRAADGAEVGQVIVLRDVTERRRLEHRLRESQRMDALGQLAGGVAHDFNNVLSGILGYAELLRRRVVRDEGATRQVEAIATAAERAAGLTTQLVAFARGSQAQVRAVDVHRIVRDACALARQTFDRRITVETWLRAEPAAIVADPSLVHTVLLNLLVNARDAMPRGGRVLVTTSNRTVAEVGADGLAAGDYVVVAVEDSGVGIAPEVIGRIFEPFFTTKAPDKGTGLGLAAVYGIMRDHRGSVGVTSRVGQGTTFHLQFPRAVGAAIEAGRPPPRGGHGRVLVVDDDGLARRPLVEALRELGYTVAEAVDGAEAVALVEHDPCRFDVVLMDMNMPVMHGRDAMAAIGARVPHLPVLVLSGYLADGDVDALMRLGAVGFVQKPWQLAALSQQLAAAIGTTP